MPKASRQFPELSKREDAPLEMVSRSLELRSKTFDHDARTVEAVISTEAPVLMPDFERMEMMPEILLSSGIEFPKSRQVPFLDSHNRRSVKDQLGSARAITIGDGQVTSTLTFSKSANAEDAISGVRDGHITDVSVGYEVKKRVYVPAGESKTISGRQFDGPLNVVTKWRLREVSLTPIGADAQAKLRGLDPAAFRFESTKKGQFQMNEELRALLVSKGMSATLTDAEAQVWLVTNRNLLSDPPTPPEKITIEKTEAGRDITTDTIQEMIEAATTNVIRKERTRAEAFRKEVDALCELSGLPAEAEHCRGLDSQDAVRQHLLTVRKNTSSEVGFAPSIRVTGEGSDRFLADVKTALTLRALESVSPPSPEGNVFVDRLAETRAKTMERVFPKATRAAGAEQWKTASMFDIAHEIVRSVMGVETRGMSRENIAIIAMFGSQRATDMGIQFRSSGAAYNNTGSFANLTLDAINKSMMLGYVEAPSTWEGPMKRGASVDDFKNINRMRIGSIPNLPVWNDNDNPVKASMADAKETYAVESRSLELDFSYRLLVNDDMGVLGPAPSQLGAAARRTVNAVAWSQITSNPTMSDGQALFLATATGNRKRSNLTTGATTPTNLSLQVLKNKMRQMRGENTPEGAESADILNLQARYLVGPGALDTTIMQLVMSVADPVTSISSAVYNPSNTLIPVIEPLLDVASTSAFYLFGDPSQIDTVEVSFLKGQETPVVRSFMNERTMSQSAIILQTFGAAPLNHRGMQKHDGA